jgi:hypothetical protein
MREEMDAILQAMEPEGAQPVARSNGAGSATDTAKSE